MEEEDDERLTELRNEVLEAQTNFRNMMMKILRGETSPVPNLFHTDDSPELRKTRLRPSMVERAIRPPPPLVSSTPMQFGRRKSFVPTTVEAVSPIIGLRRSTANTKIKTPVNENGDGGGPSAVTISDSESHMDQLIKEISRKKLEISQSQDEPERIKPRRTSNKIIQTSNQSQTLRTVSKRLARRPRATVEGAQPQLEDQISEDDDTSSLSSLLREFEKRRTIKTPVKKRDDEGGMDVGIPWRAPSGVELNEVNGELFFDSESEEDESTFRPKPPKGKRVFVNKRKLTMNRKSTSKRTDDLAVNEGSTTRSRRRGAVGNKENKKMEEEKDKNKEVVTNQKKAPKGNSGGVLESIPTEGNIFENHTEENWDDDHSLENRKHKKQDKRTEEIKGKKKKVDSVATSVNKKKLPKHEEQRRKRRESDDSLENFEDDFKRFMVEKFRQEREKKKKVDCTETASSVNKKKLPQNQEQRTKGREGSNNRDDLDSLTLEDDVFEDEEPLESRKTDKKKKAHEEHKEYKKTEEDKIKNKKVDSVAQRTKGREGNNKGDVLDSTTTKDNVFESYTVQNNMQDDDEDEESLEIRKLKNRKADKKKKAHEENKDYKKSEEKNIKNKKVDSVATCTAQRTNRDVFDNITTEDNVFENYTVENNDEEDESLENRKLERNTQKTDKRKKPFEEKRDVNRKTEEKKCKNKRVNSCTGTKNEGQMTEGRDTSNNRDVLETIEDNVFESYTVQNNMQDDEEDEESLETRKLKNRKADKKKKAHEENKDYKKTEEKNIKNKKVDSVATCTAQRSNRDVFDTITTEDNVFENYTVENNDEEDESLENRKLERNTQKTDKRKKPFEEKRDVNRKTEEKKCKNKRVNSCTGTKNEGQRTEGRDTSNNRDVLETIEDNVFESYTVQNNMQDDEEDEESLETRKLKNRKADKKKKAHEENKDYKKTEEKNIKNKKVDSVATCTAQRTNRDVFDTITTEDNVFESYTVQNNMQDDEEDDEPLENRKANKKKKAHEENKDYKKIEEKNIKNKKVDSVATCTAQRTNRDVFDTITTEGICVQNNRQDDEEDEEPLENRKVEKNIQKTDKKKKTEENKIKNKKVDLVASVNKKKLPKNEEQRTKGRKGSNNRAVLDNMTTEDNVSASCAVQNDKREDDEPVDNRKTKKKENKSKNKKVDSVATCTAHRTKGREGSNNRDVLDNITTEDNVFENYTVEINRQEDEEDESLENRKLERNTQKTDKRKKPFEEKRDVNRKTEEKKCKNKRVNSCTGTKNGGRRTEGRDTSNNRDVLETIEVTAGTSKNVVKEVSQATTNMSSNRRETTSTKRRTKKRSTSYYGDKFEVTTTQPSTVEESGVRRSGRQRRQAPVVAAGVIYCTKPTSIVPITRTLSKNTKRPQNTMSPIEEEPPVSKKRPAKTQSVVRGQSTDEEDNETDALEEAIPTATNYIATSTEDESMSPRMPRKNRSVLSGRISKPSNARVVNKKLTKSVQRTINGGFDGEFSKTLSISDKTITWMFDASGYMSLAGSPGVSYKSYDHMRMGVLKISAGKEKPPQITRQHDLYFVVAEGECIAGVMDKSHIVRKQDSFLVPRGAEYYVKNQSKTQHLILIFSRFIPNNTV